MANVLSTVIPVFRINGVSLPTPDFKWTLPEVWGIDGSGQERLHPYAQVELSWNLITYGDYTTIYDVYRGSTSGTSTVYLPSLYGDTFNYIVYSGVIVNTPRIDGQSVNGSNYLNVKMVIRKVTIRRN